MLFLATCKKPHIVHRMRPFIHQQARIQPVSNWLFNEITLSTMFSQPVENMNAILFEVWEKNVHRLLSKLNFCIIILSPSWSSIFRLYFSHSYDFIFVWLTLIRYSCAASKSIKWSSHNNSIFSHFSKFRIYLPPFDHTTVTFSTFEGFQSSRRAFGVSLKFVPPSFLLANGRGDEVPCLQPCPKYGHSLS